jgi:hypothetical protein
MERGVSRISAAVGKALLGAFAGLFCVAMARLIATDDFSLGVLESSAKSRLLVMLICVVTATGAVMAVVFGAWEFPGRIGTALKGMACGTIVGLSAGATLGFVLNSTSESPKDMAAGLTMGIFIGVYVGAIVGGVIGGTATIKAEKKKTPSWPVSSLYDRESDG